MFMLGSSQIQPCILVCLHPRGSRIASAPVFPFGQSPKKAVKKGP